MYQPQTIDEYICSEETKRAVQDAINQSKGGLLPHILIRGQSGCGKTSLVNVLKNESGYEHVVSIMGNTVSTIEELYSRIQDCVNKYTRLCKKTIVFIDEVHRLPKKAQELLFPILDNGVLINKLGTRSQVYELTIVCATTDSGAMLLPLRNRFNVTIDVTKHSIKNMLRILANNCMQFLPQTFSEESLLKVANRSRGVPRTGITFVNNIHVKYANTQEILCENVEDFFTERGIDGVGLLPRDREYLAFLSKSGTIGLDAIAFGIQLDKTVICDEIEPYLLQIGFIVKSGRGRKITNIGNEYLSLINSTKTMQISQDCYERLAGAYIQEIAGVVRRSVPDMK